MKTTYLKITASLLLLASLQISCDGCKDKKVTDTTSEEVNVDVDTINGNTSYDRTSNSNDPNRTGNSAAQKGTSTTSGTKATKKGNNGYSAPDGTDAENHDGDMYTKHDTTQRASGPPIK